MCRHSTPTRAGLMTLYSRHNPHRVWPVDIGPTPDVERSVVVGVQRKAARTTAEQFLTPPVGFVGVSALGTLAAGIARVNVDDADTRKPSFVRDFCSKVMERPRVQRRTLTTPSPYPLAYALQILKGDRQAVALRGCDDALCHDVISVVCKAAFSTGKLLEFALGRLRTPALQLGSQAAVTVAHTLNVAAAVGATFGVGRYLSHTHIDPKETLNILRRWFRHVAAGEQAERPVYQHEVAFPLLGFQQLPLPLTRAKEDGLAPRRRSDTHLVPVEFPGEDASIKGDRAERLKGALGLFIELVGVRDFGDAAHHHLRRELEPLTGVVVAEPMEVELLKGPVVPRQLAEVVARRVCSSERFFKRRKLLFRRQQLDFSRQSHTPILPYFSSMEGYQVTSAAARRAPFPPMFENTGVQGAYPA